MQRGDQDDRVAQLQAKLEQLSTLAHEWGAVRKEDLKLATQLQQRAAEEKQRAERLERQGQLEEAAEARSREQELLEEAEGVMRAAEEALNKQAEIENEQDFGKVEDPVQIRRLPNTP